MYQLQINEKTEIFHTSSILITYENYHHLYFLKVN